MSTKTRQPVFNEEMAKIMRDMAYIKTRARNLQIEFSEELRYNYLLSGLLMRVECFLPLDSQTGLFAIPIPSDKGGKVGYWKVRGPPAEKAPAAKETGRGPKPQVRGTFGVIPKPAVEDAVATETSIPSSSTSSRKRSLESDDSAPEGPAMKRHRASSPLHSDFSDTSMDDDPRGIDLFMQQFMTRPPTPPTPVAQVTPLEPTATASSTSTSALGLTITPLMATTSTPSTSQTVTSLDQQPYSPIYDLGAPLPAADESVFTRPVQEVELDDEWELESVADGADLQEERRLEAEAEALYERRYGPRRANARHRSGGGVSSLGCAGSSNAYNYGDRTSSRSRGKKCSRSDDDSDDDLEDVSRPVSRPGFLQSLFGRFNAFT